MKEFGELIWSMPAGDFAILAGLVAVWMILVVAAVVLAGRR